MLEQTKILIKACIKNDRKAQGKIYQKFSGKMYAVCLRYCKNEFDAQDCLQEAFILAFDKMHQFKFNGSFEGWLRRIVVNVCLGKLRKKNFFVLVEDHHVAEESEEFELEMEKEELDYKYVESLIQQMPSSYKMVFNLFLVEDYSHKEIADMLNISEGTSKSNLSRAKAWMRKELKKNNNFEFTFNK